MSRLVLLLGLVLCGTAHAGSRAVLPYVGPAERGRSLVLLEVTDPALATTLGTQPTAGRFRAVVTNGDARILGAERLAGSGATMYTVLAFDRSGSFRAHWNEAFALAEVFADNMPDDGSHVVSVMTFHSGQRFHGVAHTPGELRALLSMVHELNTLGSSSETSLMSAIREGTKHVSEEQPAGGGRQVVIFSDAGEEGSIFRLDETVEYVRENGVAIHPIILKQVTTPGSTSAQRFATANDRMKRVAEGSGGQYIHAVNDSVEARTRLASHATALERLYKLDVFFCDVSSPDRRFGDQIYVDVINGPTVEAHTDSASFMQHAAGDAIKPCDDLAAPEDIGTGTSSGSPSSAGSGDPDAGAGPTSGGNDGGLGSASGMALMLLAGLMLLLMFLGALALVLLFGSRSKGEPAAKAKPVPAPEPEPEPEPEVEVNDVDPLDLASDWQNPFKRSLPETHLVIVSGVEGMQEYYRVVKREFVLGADASRDVDLVFNVPQISGRHATIELYQTGALYLTDHSSNGTFVDGQRLKKGERRQIFPGQEIGLSRQVRIRMKQPGRRAPASPPPASFAAPAPAPAPPPASAPPRAAAPPPDPVPPPEPARARRKNKTVYGPIGEIPSSRPAAPPSAPPQPPHQPSSGSPSPRRQRSRTIIQPLRRDDES